MKRERGAITLYVSIVCLFVLIIGIAQYISITNKQAAQLEQLKEIEDAYNSDLTIDEVYSSYGGGDVIEIDTVGKLLKIGSNENVYIDGKIYNFGSRNTYVLLQDFKFEGDFSDVAEAIKDNQILIQGNGHKIVVTNEQGVDEYYTEESKYYIATNKYGYVLKGLELYYDGIDNTGTGEHSFVATTWKDLSGNNRDGSLVNFGSSVISGWNKNCLSFDGVNDWLNCNELNFDGITLEATYLTKSDTNKQICVLGNWQSGGAGLGVYNYLLGEIYNNSQYHTMFS